MHEHVTQRSDGCEGIKQLASWINGIRAFQSLHQFANKACIRINQKERASLCQKWSFEGETNEKMIDTIYGLEGKKYRAIEICLTVDQFSLLSK